MPQFFFHGRYGEHLVIDPKGLILADLTTAVQEALERAKWLQNNETYSSNKQNFWYEISDQNGNLIVQIPLNKMC